MYIGDDQVKIEEYEFPDNLYYTEHHFWVKEDGDIIILGITDFAQKLAGEFIYIQLPDVDKKIKKGKPFATVESGKWVGRVYAPVNGIITEINEALDDDASLMNSSPYDKGWICKIKPENKEGLNELFKTSDGKFEPWMKEEIAKNVPKK